jgi:uncharacterized protein YndB with AHSA1/START domain
MKHNMQSEILATTPDSEIVNTRIIHAPIQTVWLAWTDPAHLKNWWGPAGFGNTFQEHDLRVGGRWIFTMHGPDKGNYPNDCEFIKIEQPSLIAWKRHSQPYFQVLARFEELAPGQTKVVFKQLFETAEACSKLRPYVADKNEENLDRLEEELRKMMA